MKVENSTHYRYRLGYPTIRVSHNGGLQAVYGRGERCGGCVSQQ